jgi:hypothetical protein
MMVCRALAWDEVAGETGVYMCSCGKSISLCHISSQPHILAMASGFAGSCTAPALVTLEQIRQQQAVVDARVSDLEWHLRIARAEQANLRALVRRLLRTGKAFPSPADQSDSGESDLVVDPPHRLSLEEHWQRVREASRPLTAAPLVGVGAPAPAEAASQTASATAPAQPISQIEPETGSEPRSAAEPHPAVLQDQRRPRLKTPAGTCPVCYRLELKLPIGTFKHDTSKRCRKTRDGEGPDAAIDPPSSSGADPNGVPRADPPVKKARVLTPFGECPACWRPANGHPQGAAKHTLSERCNRKPAVTGGLAHE